MPEAEFFEKLQAQHVNKLPFVAYRKPILSENSGTVTAFLQQSDNLIYAEDFSGSGFIFAPFDTSGKTILFPEKVSEKLIFEQVVSEEGLASVTSQKGEISEEKKSAHIELVAKAVEALNGGEMEKVVLSRREEVELKEKNPLKLFKELLKAYPTAYVYCWFHPEVGCWLGATPETLLKIEGNRFKTMALAGTQKFSGTMDVEWGEKEKQEQQFVTDSIIENLKSSGVEDLEISEAYTARAGNLLHIRSDIQGILKGTAAINRGSTEINRGSTEINRGSTEINRGSTEINRGSTEINRSSTEINRGSTEMNRGSGGDLKEIIRALHPTPAVGGLPKEKAKAFILSEENYDREFYTGFMGELNLQKNRQRTRTRRNVENLAYRAVKKETDLYVNLRCMKIEDGKAVLFIGGGITKDSVPEDEWQETVNKAETMKKVLLK